MACSWFEVVNSQYAQVLGLFEDHLGALREHILGLEGPRGLFDMGKSRCMWNVAHFPSFDCFDQF